MALDLTPEQKGVGKANFEQAAGDLAREGRMKTMVTGAADPKHPNPDRRDVLRAGLAAGAVVPVSAAVYFGYQEWKGNNAVKTALIGCGDEGGVLVGDHNREFNEIVAVCDIRPTNLDRIFEGEPQGPRKGLNKLYGKDDAAKIRRYDSVDTLLADAKKLGIEAVVIATPLMTHDAIATKCMDAGLHVLCEKLMARTIGKCKAMTNYAKDKGLLLSVGHQRHYSSLYAQALEVLQSGVLGDIKHIRALWHRNNSWPFSASPADRAKYAAGNDINGQPFLLPELRDGWCKPVLAADAAPFLKNPQQLRDLGYGSVTELVRWRLYDKTGGGLMAELGSHQLDAASIILGHVHPIAVQGVGGKFFYGPGKNDRESDDGVFVTYEFPGRTYYKRDKDGHFVLKDGKPQKENDQDVVVVTYSSFNTNSFEKYGECVMGSRGTMVIEEEKDVYLFKEPEPGKAGSGGRDTKVTVTGAGGGKPAMESTSTWGGGGGAALSKSSSAPAWDSAVRGYRTEMEHFAYCVRKWQERGGKVSYEKDDQGHMKYADILPRCHGEVAMADAILALTANMAMAKRERIVFEDAWFDATSPEVPETNHAKKS
jgi:predicted dehydrogenase